MFGPRERDALVVIDVQNDFCPGGALAVGDGDSVVAPINRLAGLFSHAVATQDWHPANHTSFASQHAGSALFETVDVAYGAQTLWPDHCVQGTSGAAFHADLQTTSYELVLRKGFRKGIDSYSAFFENDKVTQTGLAGYLKERGLHRLVFAGLATDFCVAWSALDAAKLGFEAYVVLDACRAIDLNRSLDAALHDLKATGVGVLQSDEIG